MMDRTGWAAVIGCAAIFFLWQGYMQRNYPTPVPKPKGATVAPASTAAQPAASLPPEREGAVLTSDKLSPPPVNKISAPEQIVVQENEFLRAVYTSHGGGLKEVVLKQHQREGEQPIILNLAAAEPVFNFSGWEGGQILQEYRLDQSGDTVVARRRLANGVEVEQRFQLVQGNYLIRITQVIKNTTGQALTLPAYRINVGQAGPLHFHDDPAMIKTGWLEDATEHFSVTTVSEFEPSSYVFGLFGSRPARARIESPASGPLRWVSVKNQFFALILSPEGAPLIEKVESTKVTLPKMLRGSTDPHGIQAAAWFPGLVMEAGGLKEQSFRLYAGPKEYARLKPLPGREDIAMEFGFWGWMVKPLLATLKWLYTFIPNYGLTIVVLTLLVKAVLWPLQDMANRSMKKMQALAPKMKELQERYKEDPQRLNKETMKMYQEYGVNPVGGCLPMLLQLPIFLGFYTMLQSAVELRNQGFLWIHDLSQPDTIAQFALAGFSLDINPLPIIMTATTIFLMRMSPQAMDNPQMKMMQWMPLFFIFLLYNFASALALYWTVSNLVSILQTYLNLRQPVPVLKKTVKKA
jgi:YidC/Oxa1 family membrane protein insertase